MHPNIKSFLYTFFYNKNIRQRGSVKMNFFIEPELQTGPLRK